MGVKGCNVGMHTMYRYLTIIIESSRQYMYQLDLSSPNTHTIVSPRIPEPTGKAFLSRITSLTSSRSAANVSITALPILSCHLMQHRRNGLHQLFSSFLLSQHCPLFSSSQDEIVLPALLHVHPRVYRATPPTEQRGSSIQHTKRALPRREPGPRSAVAPQATWAGNTKCH